MSDMKRVIERANRFSEDRAKAYVKNQLRMQLLKKKTLLRDLEEVNKNIVMLENYKYEHVEECNEEDERLKKAREEISSIRSMLDTAEEERKHDCMYEAEKEDEEVERERIFKEEYF